jgi:Domain of unknown function (DUF1995)
VLCPRNSEADDTLRVMDIATEMNQFMILVNPELVNMGTTGYGLAGRRIRDLVLATFNSAYYLRTLAWGAVTKRCSQYTITLYKALYDCRACNVAFVYWQFKQHSSTSTACTQQPFVELHSVRLLSAMFASA